MKNYSKTACAKNRRHADKPQQGCQCASKQFGRQKEIRCLRAAGMLFCGRLSGWIMVTWAGFVLRTEEGPSKEERGDWNTKGWPGKNCRYKKKTILGMVFTDA